MGMKNFEFELEPNDEEYRVRGFSGIDEDLRMLGKYANRLAIHGLEIKSQRYEATKETLTDISFLFIAQPHPECSFEWIRLLVNLDQWPGCEIKDLLPRTEKGDQPVKYTVSNEMGFSIEATSIKLGPKYTRKQETEHTIYFEKIIASGKGSVKALWDFYQQPHTRLNLENLVKVKATHAEIVPLATPGFLVEAKLRINGWKGLIPLVGKKLISVG